MHRIGLASAAALVAVTGCAFTVVAPLRDTGGLHATCTGSAMPRLDDCQAQGEGAWIEMQQPGEKIVRIDVAFGSVGEDGCRTVTWTVAYQSGTRAEQPTQVCT